MPRLGTARTIVACCVAVIGTAAIAIPIGTYFNTARGVQYTEVKNSVRVEYGAVLPSPLTSCPAVNASDYDIPKVDSVTYFPGAEIGTPDMHVTYRFEPLTTSATSERIKCTVAIEVVKAKAAPQTQTATETFTQGTTAFPVKTDAQLPDPSVGFKRPWTLVGYIWLPSGRTLTADTLPKLQSGQQFTATYVADIDETHYEGTEKTKYVITYNVVAR